MSNNPHTPQVGLYDDQGATFFIRWRGRQEGPYTAAIIEAKLSANQIGLLHEISHNGQWVTLRDYFAEREAVLNAERLAREEQERRTREEGERQARAKEEQRRAGLLAEEERKKAQAQSEPSEQIREHQPSFNVSAEKKGTSGLPMFGVLLLILGLVVAAYFFLAFDASVESGGGRVNNLGLMADRQNGLIAGIGLCIVGTIMLAIRSLGKN
jgi:hypothetical protein